MIKLSTQKYVCLTSKDLVDELKSELRGNLEEAIEALMTPPPVFDAKTLRNAMKVQGCILLNKLPKQTFFLRLKKYTKKSHSFLL